MLDTQDTTAVSNDDEPVQGHDDNLFDPRPKFLRFNKYPHTEKARACVQDIAKLILDAEVEAGSRKRQRRPDDQRLFEQQVAALVSELVCHVLTPEDDRKLFFNRSNNVLGKRSSYKPAFVTKKLKDVVDGLIKVGLIEQELGWKANGAARGIATAIHPTPDFKSAVADRGLTRDDFKTLRPKEPIVLKADKREDGTGKKIVYAETAETSAYRQEVDEINQWINEAELGFDQSYTKGKPVDTTNTYLSRIFTGASFCNHGRLYGGFWQGLSEYQRLKGITINGEPVREIDFKAMIVRIAYSYAKAKLPQGELYAIPGYEGEACRKAIKKVTSSLFFRQTPMMRLPTGTEPYLPRGSDYRKVKVDVTSYHHGIAHLLDTNVGHELTLLESRLMIEVMRRLRLLKVVALPLHDCIIVPDSASTVAKKVMLASCLDLLSVSGEVTVK